MFNIGGGEMVVILLLALIVLGPQRLPDAAKQMGKFMGELRRMSTGFQQELRSAMDDPIEAAARERGAKAAASRPSPTAPATPEAPPVEATEPENQAPAQKQAAAKRSAAKKATAAVKKAPARKRTAPLRAPGKPDGPAAP